MKIMHNIIYMRTIFIFIGLVFCLIMISAFGKPIPESNSDDFEFILRHPLPDSLYSLLRGKPVIFFTHGHYGYSWSLIAKMDSGYQAFSGRVTYGGERYTNKLTESTQIDSARFFSQNQDLLSWGFDTISSKINIMKEISRGPYMSIRRNLQVINSEGINVFTSDATAAYSGPDSLDFNKKFRKLCLIMWWLSDYRLREYIPDSAIYQ